MTDTERIELLEKQVAELQSFVQSLVLELGSAYIRLEDENTALLTMDKDYIFEDQVWTLTAKPD